jgi:hypothetical protein
VADQPQWVGIVLDPKLFKLVERGVVAAERLVIAFEKMAERPAAAPAAAAPSGPTFPFGKNKGQSIVGASPDDLRWHAGKAMQELSDPSKSRYHGRTRDWFAALNAELVRQGQAPVVPPDEPDEDQGDDEGGGYDDGGAADDDAPVI